MKPLKRSAPSAQAKFDEAVRMVKALVPGGETATRYLGEDAASSRQSPQSSVSGTDINDIAPLIAEDASETSLDNILAAFELHPGEAELQVAGYPTGKGGPSQSEGAPDRSRESHPLIKQSPPIGLDGSSLPEILPSFRFIVWVITFAQITAGIILAIAVAAWFSISPYKPGNEATTQLTLDSSSSAWTSLNETIRAVMAKLRGNGFVVEMLPAKPASERSNHAPPTSSEVKTSGLGPPWRDPDSMLSGLPPALGPGPKTASQAPAEDAQENKTSSALQSVPPRDDQPKPKEATLEYEAPPAPDLDLPLSKDISTTNTADGSFRQQELAERETVVINLPEMRAPMEAAEMKEISPAIEKFTDQSPEATVITTSDPLLPQQNKVWLPVEHSNLPELQAEKNSERQGPDTASNSSAIQRNQTFTLRLHSTSRSGVKLVLPRTVAGQFSPMPGMSSDRQAPQSPQDPRSDPNPAPIDFKEQRLLERADLLLKNSDISGARLILERAVAAGSSRAAYMLAQTYDPRALQDKWSVLGIKGDPEKARDLYLRARAGGVHELGERAEAQ